MKPPSDRLHPGVVEGADKLTLLPGYVREPGHHCVMVAHGVAEGSGTST